MPELTDHVVDEDIAREYQAYRQAEMERLRAKERMREGKIKTRDLDEKEFKD